MAHHKPSKVAQLGRRVFSVDASDDRTAAIEAVASIRAFFGAVLRMPLTFKQLGIENPDIDTMVRKLHENKGEKIGGYYKLTAADNTPDLRTDAGHRTTITTLYKLTVSKKLYPRVVTALATARGYSFFMHLGCTVSTLFGIFVLGKFH